MTETVEPPPAHGVRLPWPKLPLPVREAIEQAVRMPIVAVAEQLGGFSPGVAARLELGDGSYRFVKATGAELNPDSHRIYRMEAGIAAALPERVPAARLLDSLEVGDWIALLFEYLPGRQPRQPWVDAELRAVLRLLAELPGLLTPSPLPAPTAAEQVGHVPWVGRRHHRAAGDQCLGVQPAVHRGIQREDHAVDPRRPARRPRPVQQHHPTVIGEQQVVRPQVQVHQGVPDQPAACGEPVGNLGQPVQVLAFGRREVGRRVLGQDTPGTQLVGHLVTQGRHVGRARRGQHGELGERGQHPGGRGPGPRQRGRGAVHHVEDQRDPLAVRLGRPGPLHVRPQAGHRQVLRQLGGDRGLGAQQLRGVRVQRRPHGFDERPGPVGAGHHRGRARGEAPRAG